uniref:Secreted protein n=1 Tax=Cacopsylla melanoneura TaxID=428564 RepID=A0A8D9EM31_9HEMI
MNGSSLWFSSFSCPIIVAIDWGRAGWPRWCWLEAVSAAGCVDELFVAGCCGGVALVPGRVGSGSVSILGGLSASRGVSGQDGDSTMGLMGDSASSIMDRSSGRPPAPVLGPLDSTSSIVMSMVSSDCWLLVF